MTKNQIVCLLTDLNVKKEAPTSASQFSSLGLLKRVIETLPSCTLNKYRLWHLSHLIVPSTIVTAWMSILSHFGQWI